MHTIEFDPTKPIDLHAHSTASDGTDSPASLIIAAHNAGIGTIALTDHDTTGGWGAAQAQADELGITLIPGIEYSAQIQSSSVHILGYLIDRSHPELIRSLETIRADRISRVQRMAEAISADYPISWADVLAEVENGATIGRPHVADALISKGIVPDRSTAFASILHRQGGYYVPQRAPHPVEVIKSIHAAHGVAVLAHGGSRGSLAMRGGNFTAIIEAGLDGVEIGHRENDEASREVLSSYANQYKLIVTGASDYHGSGKPNRLAENTTEPEQLQRIIDLAAHRSR